MLINETQLFLNYVYDSVGFSLIPNEILRHLVISRVSQPMSKLATVEFLKSYYNEDVNSNNIYRYMDKLYNTQMELAQQISVNHIRKIFGGKIGLMFYEVTTLHFETTRTDVLRRINNRIYNKFLEISKAVEARISDGKIEQNTGWDGLKGYITNTNLEAEKVIAQYHSLWFVEQVFRTPKGSLE